MSEVKEILEEEELESPAPEPKGEEEIDWKAKAEEAEAKAKKAEETANNYKREIEDKGIRKKDRKIEVPAPIEGNSTLTEEQIALVKHDYLSKREDVYADVEEKLKGLTDEEFDNIKTLIPVALDKEYVTAIQSGKYVARGRLMKSVEDLIKFAKGDKLNKEAIEKARKEGIDEGERFDKAEIPSVRSSGGRRTKSSSVTDEDRAYSETSDGEVTPERAKEIREAREARKAEYANNLQTGEV